MCVSLLSAKLNDIQQLAHTLFQRQSVIINQVRSLFCKANFCVRGHVQLHPLCHLIQSDMLNVYYCSTHIISFFFTFLSLLSISSRGCLSCNRVQFPCGFLFLMWLLLPMLCLIFGAFIFSPGVSISCCGTWCHSMFNIQIALKELWAFVLMLHKMAFQYTPWLLTVLHMLADVPH